jgi:hypothetical protein
MKKSQDMPMADRSKVSGEREPMSEKKGQPSGSGVARGIGARGVDMCQGEAPSLKEFMPMADSMMDGGRNAYGIGSGDGGPTIDKMGPDNPGEPL